MDTKHAHDLSLLAATKALTGGQLHFPKIQMFTQRRLAYIQETVRRKRTRTVACPATERTEGIGKL
jgi:hypothetical protein